MEGTKVYIPDAECTWIPATVLSIDPDDPHLIQVVVQTGENPTSHEADINEHDIRSINLNEATMPNPLPLQNPPLTEPRMLEDLANLNCLHEPAIVYTLRRRFNQQLPYTAVGPMMILAINPYEWQPELYSPILQRAYLDNEDLPPHVYTTSSSAYRDLLRDRRHQSILVSGESGAGKTETVKLMMEHLASVNHHHHRDSTGGRGDQVTSIDQVLRSNPLLESFGNAKTIRNDNSSRFGKFTQLWFDLTNTSGSGEMTGASCRHYLLEKSRVVAQARGERNYHIFYQLFHLPPPLVIPELEITPPSSFHYLSRAMNDPNLAREYAPQAKATCEALTLIGLDVITQQALFHLLAGILYLGQIQFHTESKNDDLTVASQYLGLENADDLVTVCCHRTVKARNESYTVPLSEEEALGNRDALAKELYARAFAWMLDRVNQVISLSSRGTQDTHLSIALLDIFGFESFQVNGFEQFCINFANEKLQQKFTQDVFKSVQEEYALEGLDWTTVAFEDNQTMVDLIERPMGLIALLNEECVRPKGSDASFVSKIMTVHEHQRDIEKNKLNPMCFTLHHYADSVMYSAEFFVEKNKDTLQHDLEDVMTLSTNIIVQELFPLSTRDASSSVSGPPDCPRPRKESSTSNNKMMQQTVSFKFKHQLSQLLSEINLTSVHYVRCIKPNHEKLPKLYTIPAVVNQLRCAGVVEAIRITRARFPNKLTHAAFLLRFLMLKKTHLNTRFSSSSKSSRARTTLTTSSGTASSAATRLASTLFPSSSTEKSSFVVGTHHIYFCSGALEELENQRTTVVHEDALVIQREARRWLAQMHYQKFRKSIIILQSWSRAQHALIQYYQFREAVIAIQANWKGRHVRQLCQLQLQDKMITRITTLVRQRQARRQYQRIRESVILIQRQIKTRIERAKYLQRLTEQREQQAMTAQLQRLHERLASEQLAREEIEARNSSLQAQLNEHRRASQELSLSSAELATLKVAKPGNSTPGPVNNTLLSDSTAMIEVLNAEVEKLRQLSEDLKTENDGLRSENKRVKDAYTSAGASFAALNQHNKQQSKANLRLMTTHAALIKSQEEKMKKYHKQIVSLKEELRMQRNVYSAELLARVQQQEHILDILHLAESHASVPQELVMKMRDIADAPVAVVPEPHHNGQAGLSGQGSEEVDRSSTIGGMFKKIFKKEDE